MEPLKTHWFQVLLALSRGAQHGTAIVRQVLEQTDGEFRLWPVTLYRTLDALEKRGLIIELSGPGQHPEGKSRRRRYYQLTKKGAEVLAAEAQRLAVFARAARRNVKAERWRAAD